MDLPLRRTVLLVAALAGVASLAPSAGAQPPGGRGRGMGMGGMVSHAALLRQEAVQADLALTADQKTKIAAELPERGPGGGGGNPRDMTDEERQKWMEERRARQAEDDKKVAGLVDAKQLARLKQIRVQALGGAALMDEAVAKEVGITDDQVGKLQTAMQGLRGQGQGQGNPGEMRQKAYEAALGILTPEQKTKLEALRGPAFDLSKIQLRAGGGRGGRGAL